jgi:uncharacterized protein (TIGR02678 family)
MSVITDTSFADAVRAFLRRPLLDRSSPAWSAIVTNRTALIEYFEENCGWTLHVDTRLGLARLHKRCAPDATRPLNRVGDKPNNPMRPDGYAVLMLTAAELVTRPVTTIGSLADNLAAASLTDPTLPPFDTGVATHRRQLVDAIAWFVSHNLLEVTAGNLDDYQERSGDAVLVADPTRFGRLLSSATPPSRLQAGDDWIAALAHEPRYDSVAEGRADAEAENRYARHTIGRRLLDNPALLTADLDEIQARYLTQGGGFAALRRAVGRAGLDLEANSDCVVAVDETTESTDRTFGRSADTVTQVAVAIIDLLCPNRDGTTAPIEDVVDLVAMLLAEDTGWAVAYQNDGGAQRLTDSALQLLAGFGLARFDDDNNPTGVTATPAAGRFVTTVNDCRHDTAPTNEENEL